MYPFNVVEPAAPDTSAVPIVRPPKLDHTDTALIRKAMHAVTKQYPGAAGKILAQTLLDYHEFGYRVSRTSLVAELVDEVLAKIPVQR